MPFPLLTNRFQHPNLIGDLHRLQYSLLCITYEGRTESHEQLLFACELGTADEGECSGRRNQLLCYP